VVVEQHDHFDHIEAQMAFELPPLPYGYDALEPHIDAGTMRLHHDRHHQTYVTNANNALQGTEWADRPVAQVLQNLDQIPDDRRSVVRNNAGGHYNHSLFWRWLSPDGGGEPEGALREALDATFGSLQEFKATLKNVAVAQFGSGWAWLVHDGSGLGVVSTPNQDSPISDGETALLGVDVWEHAYYLKYQNRRPEYIDAWWNVVNWPRVAQSYEAVSEAALAD
jgi:Fe-Mn family superoxide dismutase